MLNKKGKTMNEQEKEVIESLKETMQTLAFVVFLSIKNHPDQDCVDNIERVLTRARACIAKSPYPFT